LLRYEAGACAQAAIASRVGMTRARTFATNPQLRRQGLAPMLRIMEVAIYPPMLPSRPCRFCLSLHGDSVFADFDVDPDGRVFAVRVSFDGYGCCTAPTDVGRMDVRDSAALLAMVEQGSINSTASELLRAYFQQNCNAFWNDALAHHGLI
jgi:hypothetical protein